MHHTSPESGRCAPNRSLRRRQRTRTTSRRSIASEHLYRYPSLSSTLQSVACQTTPASVDSRSASATERPPATRGTLPRVRGATPSRIRPAARADAAGYHGSPFASSVTRVQNSTRRSPRTRARAQSCASATQRDVRHAVVAVSVDPARRCPEHLNLRPPMLRQLHVDSRPRPRAAAEPSALAYSNSGGMQRRRALGSPAPPLPSFISP